VVRIPMSGRVESLNVSVAGALALFEVRRRRGLPPSP
jgi:tRNA G18 (ribose-2'-O)-methylase SpoU